MNLYTRLKKLEEQIKLTYKEEDLNISSMTPEERRERIKFLTNKMAEGVEENGDNKENPKLYSMSFEERVKSIIDNLVQGMDINGIRNLYKEYAIKYPELAKYIKKFYGGLIE